MCFGRREGTSASFWGILYGMGVIRQAQEVRFHASYGNAFEGEGASTLQSMRFDF